MILCTVYKKSHLSTMHGSLGMYTPQGAEKDYSDLTNVKRIDMVIVECAI